MPDSCIICKTTGRSKYSLHRFPSDCHKRREWLKALDLKENEILKYHRVCSRHFPNQDASQIPMLHIGKKFRSPVKSLTKRGERASKRSRRLSFSPSPKPSPSPKSASSFNVSIMTTSTSEDEPSTSMSTPSAEPLLLSSAYDIHDIPSEESSPSSMDISLAGPSKSSHQDVIVTALVARLEALETENKLLKCKSSSKRGPLRIEIVSHSDSLVKFYTGFSTYEQLKFFFEFLGQAVYSLNYWGANKSLKKRKRQTKLNPFNQLFMTLIKLRLNLKEQDIAYRFDISVSTVSKYFITWICFLYHHLTEISWMPSLEQVRKTLPQEFKEKFPDTYAIIDATEIFIEVPCDLQNQSSTWSNYKHHNTAKVLIACTPNGVVCFVSNLYVGSISDVELTRLSGFVEKLSGKSGASIMADRGFTIKDQLAKHGVSLNIPPFLEGRAQLPAAEIQKGRKIASLRIHVERIIGRIKNFNILKGTLPLSMARIADQIVTVCSLLVNFQPVLIPCVSTNCDDNDLYFEEYFKALSDSDYDGDTESTDND